MGKAHGQSQDDCPWLPAFASHDNFDHEAPRAPSLPEGQKTGNLLTMRSKSARLVMWSSADSEKKEGLAGAGAREQARGRGRAAVILGGSERSPSSTSHLLRRKMLRMPRRNRHDGGRHWDSGMRREEAEASQASGNPAWKANMSLRIKRYKKGRHHPRFETPTRSQTFTPKASTRQATI